MYVYPCTFMEKIEVENPICKCKPAKRKCELKWKTRKNYSNRKRSSCAERDLHKSKWLKYVCRWESVKKAVEIIFKIFVFEQKTVAIQ